MFDIKKLQEEQSELNEDYYRKIVQSVSFLKRKLGNFKPFIAVAFGSGIGDLALDKNFKVYKSFDFEKIPNFPVPKVAGHKGKLIFATYKEVPLVLLQGRVHVYEVLDWQCGPIWATRIATLPFRVIKGLEVREIITTHACGGLAYNKSTDLQVGDLGIIFDHTNLLGISPLMGLNDERLGVRFPSKGMVADPQMIKNFISGVPNKRCHLAHYITSSSTPNYEGMGDLNAGLLKKECLKTSSKIVACFGMSMSFEADVIKHSSDLVAYLPIGLISNIISYPETTTVEEFSKFNPNPTSHKEVLMAQKKIAENFLPALLSYLAFLRKKKRRFINWKSR